MMAHSLFYSQEDTDKKARELLKKHGFVGLVDTLKKLL